MMFGKQTGKMDTATYEKETNNNYLVMPRNTEAKKKKKIRSMFKEVKYTKVFHSM